MKVLAIGDVVGKNGCQILREKLKMLRKERNIDLVIANGENSSETGGIIPESARYMFECGVNVITTGNHIFKRKQIRVFLDETKNILRPYNYPKKTTPGLGVCKVEVNGLKVGVANVMGTVFMEPLGNPFDAVDEILEELSDCKIKIIDFHAEATAEKRSIAFYLDGKISAFFGTHTHVQTADEYILPLGTGYITDVGMTGVINSVLGIKKDLSIKFMKEMLPVKFENASGACSLEGAIFDISESTGKTREIERIRVFG